LQAVVEIASERSRTLVVPVPVELLRFLDRAARAASQAQRIAPPAAKPAGRQPPSAASAPTLTLPPR
jgi:hypothetical protein